MIKTYAALILLGMLVVVSQGQDWLGGGYVRSGDYGDTRQYFSDPIFNSQGGHYVSPDPSVRQMQESLDRPIRNYATSGYATAQPSTGYTDTGAKFLNMAGSWQIVLADGTSINLNLHQSGKLVFGKGSVISVITNQWALANGDLSGSRLNLNVVTESGVELYLISIDISKLPYSGSYTLIRTNAEPVSRIIKNIRWSP